MTATYPEAILHQPIQTLELSETFKQVTERWGYHTLADLLQVQNGYDLLKQEGFNYHLLAEYTAIMEKHGVGHYLN